MEDLRELKDQLETVRAECAELESALLGVSLLSFLDMFHS